MGSIGTGFGDGARANLPHYRVRPVSLGTMCEASCAGVCASLSLDTVCRLAVLGRRWSGQAPLLWDPPSAKDCDGRVDCDCASCPDGVKLLALGVFRLGSVCVVLVMGFAEQRPHRGAVGRCIRGYTSAMCAWCRWGRGDAARGPAGCGMFLCRAVAAMCPGRRDGAPCRRSADLVSRGIDVLSWLFVRVCLWVLELVGKERSEVGCMACRGS